MNNCCRVRLAYLPLAGLTAACLLIGTPGPSTAVTPTPLVVELDPIAILASATPGPAATLMPQQEIANQLAGYGITVANIDDLSVDVLQPIGAAAAALGSRTPDLLDLASTAEADRQASVTTVFGPTVIRVYADRDRVDGVNYAINCGWEGRGAEGCRHPSIFPEQEYPTGAWLILFAGQPLLDDAKNTALVIHEMSHNLTWGGGHNPNNVGGFSYPNYVGDDFAIQYSSDLGIQLGSDSYRDQAARGANSRWRAEITADAIASWMLDLFLGPYADSISDYIHDMLVCEIMGGPKC